MPRGEAVHYRERVLLEEAGADVDSVLLVSKPYEERRSYATESPHKTARTVGRCCPFGTSMHAFR